MTTVDQIFEFERDFAHSLRCIPMAVRLKLDLCGIKVSLRQWSRFTQEDRRMLLEKPGDTPLEIVDYRAEVVGLISTRAGEAPVELPDAAAPLDWLQEEGAPDQLARYMAASGLPPLAHAAWRRLSPLQRFALIKLSRDQHDNINFVPALHEFGLAAAASQGAA